MGADDAYAVSTCSMQHWDGDTWSALESPERPRDPGCVGLHDVWPVSATEVWAGDEWEGDMWSWNGDQWRRYETGTLRITDIWGSAPDDIYAVGRIAVVHRDGTGEWDVVVIAPELIEPKSVWVFSSADVWVGGVDAVAHWDGTRWTAMPLAGTWVAMWGAAPNDVWAVGGDAIAHWDGTTWTTNAVAEGIRLFEVHGVAAHQVWAIGRRGEDLAESVGIVLGYDP